MSGAEGSERLEPLVARLRDDPRVLGLARLAPEETRLLRVVIVATWDGLEPLSGALPELGASIAGAEEARGFAERAHWTSLTAGLTRIEIEVLRAADLKPARRAARASALLDPNGLVEQWVRYSDRAPTEPASADPADTSRARVRRLLDAEEVLREFERMPRGSHVVRSGGASFPVRPVLGARLRSLARELSPAEPVEAALAARIGTALRTMPLSGEGLRVLPGEDPIAAFEEFLRTADDEGFKGDRVLFAAATERLAALSGRTLVFDEGYVTPTFDRVEARFRLGEAIGGCQPPLVPGVCVGVGVTPDDRLEFWAAPFVREATATVACVADTGARDVRARSVGREALVAACTDTVDAAWERLPGLVDRAREATREPVSDAASALRALHLPRSFVEATLEGGVSPLLTSRLLLALALARAGEDGAPAVARQFGLAAGRLLAGEPAAA